ncbi:MAG: hypothetical protein GXP39_18915 [Chloroflexi bacterium]|nr:hypothetical protein [Chloroflexota bacterium]
MKEKFAEAALGAVISLMLNIGLIGGGAYLLFDFREDLHQLNAARAEIAREIAENDYAMQLIISWNRPEYQRSQDIIHLYRQISAVKHAPQLDPQFRAQSQGQAQSILVTLTALKGDVEGTHFSTPVLVRYQQSLVQTLEPQIEMVTILRDLLRDWENLTLRERDAKLDLYQEHVLREVEKQSQHASVIRDAMAYYQQKMNDDELRRAEILSEFTSIYVKIGLSVVGILVGIAFLYRSLSGIWFAFGRR